MVIKVATLQEAADIKTMVASNKATMEKIAKEIFPQASKLIDSIAKKYNLKYLVDKQYKLLSDSQDYYYYNVKESGYGFGVFFLFTITGSKICDDPDDFDWNTWEDAVFELCREVNKLEVVKKYGKVETEQPDDGDQINFYVKHSLLLTPDDLEQQKKEAEEQWQQEYKRKQEEAKKEQEVNKKVNALTKKYFTKMKQDAIALGNSFVQAVKKDFDSVNKDFSGKLQHEIRTCDNPHYMCRLTISFKTDLIKKDPIVEKAMKDLQSYSKKNNKILKNSPYSFRCIVYNTRFTYSENCKNNIVSAYCEYGIDPEAWLRNHNLLESSLIEEFDQDILMENCIDEQVLQEMNFSKKDLQDPATIDKILKRKGVFENVIKYTAFLFSALNFAAGIVVKVKLDKADVTGSGGIGAGTVLLLELILVKIHGLVKDIPAKNYVKNIDKYKKQVQDLITKMEEKKKSDPDNADKYQKVIDNCKSVLAEFDRRDKEAQKIQKEQYLQAVEGFYSDLKLWWHNPGCFGHTGGYDDYLTKYQSLKLAELYGIKEQVVIDNFASKLKNKQYIIDPDRYSLIFGEDDADDIQKAFKDSRLFLFKSDDDYSKFVVEKTKKMYETYAGITYKPCGIYADVEDEVNRDALKEFDKIHGFYKFSKCPDAVKQKDFLEELNRKSSVKESTDMVVNINESPVKESVEESITEGFGIDKSQKASLSDLELSYDRKFNAFCLSVSSYSPEKLRNTLLQKQNALSAAQKEKKEAKDRYTKLAAQLKIDYLKNTIEKTNDLIKKKSKAAASAAPKKKAVSESVEAINELFDKHKSEQ